MYIIKKLEKVHTKKKPWIISIFFKSWNKNKTKCRLSVKPKEDSFECLKESTKPPASLREGKTERKKKRKCKSTRSQTRSG